MEKAQKIKKTYSNKAKASGKPMILTKQMEGKIQKYCLWERNESGEKNKK